MNPKEKDLLNSSYGVNHKSPTFRSATYSEIAGVLGISRQAVGKKLNGNSEFTLHEVLKLYSVYGISMWDLKDVIDETTEAYKRRKEKGLWQSKK